LVVALLLAFIVHQKRKLARHFEMNGGNILKKVIGLTIFTEKDLKKITKNNSECLGNGFFGKVYKGTLPDGTVVAVKSFIKVDAERIEEFTEEVLIQLKMDHPNILKLMGCCLQLDVPMLVYDSMSLQPMEASGTFFTATKGKNSRQSYGWTLQLSLQKD
jgi:hypothetical protein